MNLDAYFSRIGFQGMRKPTLDTLRALMLAHQQTVPFENLDVLLDRRISLDPADLEQKFIIARRGGYCFEQNTLFREVLLSLGFQVTALLARVRWQVPPEVLTPLTHMVLQVEIEGRPWLADVGFGGVGSTAPLAMDTTEAQTTSHDTRRLIIRDGAMVQQMLIGGVWADVYQFRQEIPAPMDFEMGNLFSCVHPKAHFRNNMVVTLVRPDCRLTLLNREFTVRQLNGQVQTRTIQTGDELLSLLRDQFGLHFPSGTCFGSPGAPWPQ